MRRLLRIVAIVLGLGAGGAAVAAGLLVWRLRQGPVSIDFLVPRIAAALAAGDDRWRVGVDGLDLVWAAAAHQVELRARGLRVAKADGAGQASLDAARIRLRRRALLRGEVVVTAIELDGPALTLARDAAGRVGVQVGRAPEGSEDVDWLDAMVQRLEHVSVRNGQVTLVDEQRGTRWSLPHVDGDAWRAGGPVHVQLGLSLESDAGPVPVWIEGTYRPEPGSLALVATSPGVATGVALAEWPVSVAPEAREWVTSHVKDGRVRDLRVECAGRVVRDGSRGLEVDTAEARFAFDGVAVRYLDTMPPATGLGGTARLTPEDITLAVEAGKLDALAVGPATVRVAWPPNARNHLAVDVTARGPLPSLLAVLEHEPVALTRRVGIASRDVAGTAMSRVRLAFPLGGSPALGKLGLHATSTVTGATVRRVAGDRDLVNGAATVTVDDRTIELRGAAELGGVPVGLRYEARLGSSTSNRLVVTSRLDDAARERLGLATAPALVGPVDVSVRLVPVPGGGMAAAVDADLTPAVLDVGAIALRKAAGARGRAAGRLALAGGVVTAVEQAEATAGAVTIRGSAWRADGGAAWERAEGTVSFAVPGGPGRLDVGLQAQGDRWRTTLASSDLGLLLRGYGYDKARGGRMTFDGTTDLRGADFGVEGRVSVEGVTLVGVPWMVKLASLVSLRGLLSIGSERVAVIDRFVATVARRPQSTIEVRDGVAQGPNVGGTISGTIDYVADTLDLEGTLVPSYYLLNQGAGRIPVIGGLIDRATGGAVQAVSFKARGPGADPSVTVQPLSSLAPGVLRDWLRKLGL